MFVEDRETPRTSGVCGALIFRQGGGVDGHGRGGEAGGERGVPGTTTFSFRHKGPPVSNTESDLYYSGCSRQGPRPPASTCRKGRRCTDSDCPVSVCGHSEGPLRRTDTPPIRRTTRGRVVPSKREERGEERRIEKERGREDTHTTLKTSI